jgi:hypothetical protein
MLQQQLRHYHEEILALRSQNSQEFNLGFHHGRSTGFADAMRMSLPSPHDRLDPRGNFPSPHDRHDYRGRPPHRDDDDYDEDMQRAIRASRHETRRDHPGDTPGAGPSRAPSHSRPRPPAPSQSRLDTAASSQPRAHVPPVAPSATPIPPTAATPSHHDYVVDVIQLNGEFFPDPAKTKWPGFACVPLPFGARPPLTGGPATVRGPVTPPKPEDATSYIELWAGFANGRTVPDPFRRFFLTGVRFDNSWMRTAVLGYGIARRIAVVQSHNLDRHAINAFLVTLAAFDRALDLCRHSKRQRTLWELILRRDPSRPTNNWEAVSGFMNRETYVLTTFGLSFTPPADTSRPWVIRTLWRRDAFMQVLLAIRPTLDAFNALLAYADVIIRTRPANMPFPGIALPNEPADRMYTASFVSGPDCPDAFLDDPPSTTTAEPSGAMEVDESPPAPPADPPPPHT